MIRYVTATEYNRPTTVGRTGPSIVTCELEDGSFVEVVAKFSAGCEEGAIHLAREVVAASLAADLGLPVPEPFLVRIPAEWAQTISNIEMRAKIERSSPIAFGSKLVTGQFSAWGTGNKISDIMLPTAAAIFAFDGIVQNPDRCLGNPNCLVRQDDLRIFDHEFAFSHGLVLGWKAPWVIGGLHDFAAKGNHIFREGLRGRAIDFSPIRNAWANVLDEHVQHYMDSIPAEWTGVHQSVTRAIQLIRDARDNIGGCLDEIRRVLA